MLYCILRIHLWLEILLLDSFIIWQLALCHHIFADEYAKSILRLLYLFFQGESDVFIEIETGCYLLEVDARNEEINETKGVQTVQLTKPDLFRVKLCQRVGNLHGQCPITRPNQKPIGNNRV